MEETNKQRLINNFTAYWNKRTDKQLLKEIDSYHKYFSRFSSDWSIANVNKDGDFTQADKLLELKEIARVRNLI